MDNLCQSTEQEQQQLQQEKQQQQQEQQQKEQQQQQHQQQQRKSKIHYFFIDTVILVLVVVAIMTMSRTIGRHYTTLANVSSSSAFFAVDALTLTPMAKTCMTTAVTTRNSRNRNSKDCIHSNSISNIVAYASKDDSTSSAETSSSSSSSPISSSYDMVVVGGGSAGLTAAKFAAGTLKKSVLIVEEERLGGDCTWTGCVPSKSLLSQAKASKMARNYAISQHQHQQQQQQKQEQNNQHSETETTTTTDDDILRQQSRANFEKVRTYFRDVQESIYEDDDSPKAMQKFGIDTIEGQKARLISPTTLSFDTTTTSTTSTTSTTTIVEAKEGILLCTGAKPNRPTSTTIPGLSDIDYLTYEEIWTRQFPEDGSLPHRWTVVGGGPIGCELAQALSRLGASVTIITGSSGKLLPNVDDDEVSQLMKDVFEKDENIRVVQGSLSKVEAVVSSPKDGNDNETTKTKTCRHVAYVKTTDSSATSGDQSLVAVESDVMLLSIGRKPNTAGLGLETLGIDINEKTGGIAVDDTLKTTVDGIYAAGDCTGDKQFTHYAGTCQSVSQTLLLLLLLLLLATEQLVRLLLLLLVVDHFMLHYITLPFRSFTNFRFQFCLFVSFP